MGARGPKKKLPAISRIEGNPGKRRIEDSGIEALGSPFVSENLSDEARGAFEVVRMSMPPEIYSALDSYLLHAYAQTAALLAQAEHEMAKPGFRQVNDDGQESRWVAGFRKNAMTLAALGDRLGLDPKSRAALKLPKANQQREEFDGLIGRRISSASLKPSEYQAE